MATGSPQWRDESVAQGSVLLVLSTVTLTAAFLGVVGLVTGDVRGLSARLPFYVLAMALAFVGAVVIFEGELRDGRQILRTSALLAVGTLLVVGLSGEGVAYLVQHTEEVLSSQLLFYFLAAGLIGAGLGYWAMRHWNELTRPRSGL